MSGSQRKRTFVDPEVQGALVLHVAGYWAGFFALIFIILCCGEYMFSLPGERASSAISRVWHRHALIFIAMLTVLPAMVNQIIRVSHRFVGPVVRIRSELQKVQSGKPFQPIKLRNDDYWLGLAADVNAAMAKVTDGVQNDASATNIPQDVSAVPSNTDAVERELVSV